MGDELVPRAMDALLLAAIFASKALIAVWGFWPLI
jgi:hypothetical protein